MAMPTNKAMYLVERHDWGAVAPRYRFKAERPVKYILLRHTNTDPCTDYDSCCQTVRDLQKKHTEDKGWADILYRSGGIFTARKRMIYNLALMAFSLSPTIYFLIGGDGKVYEGTGWVYTTNKEMEYAMHDFNNVDIAYIGRSQDDVTPDMRWAARKLLEHSMSLEQVDPESTYLGDQKAIDLLFT